MANVQRVQISREERHLIIDAYRVHGGQWGGIVDHVLQHADPQGPVVQYYLRRNNEQLRRKVRDAIHRDVAR